MTPAEKIVQELIEADEIDPKGFVNRHDQLAHDIHRKFRVMFPDHEIHLVDDIV
jgi:hypothetical protein